MPGPGTALGSPEFIPGHDMYESGSIFPMHLEMESDPRDQDSGIGEVTFESRTVLCVTLSDSLHAHSMDPKSKFCYRT